MATQEYTGNDEAPETADNWDLLDVRNLKTYFNTEEGVVTAVNDVSFTLRKGEILGLVGESGCGKSVASLSIMRLIPEPPGKIVGGQILFRGNDLVQLRDDQMEKIRGNDISMIFQEPMTALNPVFTVGEQIDEVIRVHTALSKHERKEKVVEILSSVGIPEPQKRAASYPHELSGGMRQRVVIAMAVACSPSLLIADEPTTALDVTIQAQILELIKAMQQEIGSSVILITHDLAVIAETVDKVAVMYAGVIVEQADVKSLFDEPLHPYTQGLMNSIPVLGNTRKKLKSIPGRVPNLIDLPQGCYFQNRCPFVKDICRVQLPELKEHRPGHLARCHLYE